MIQAGWPFQSADRERHVVLGMIRSLLVIGLLGCAGLLEPAYAAAVEPLVLDR